MISGSVLESSSFEKDLGVMIPNDLKCTSHTDYVVLKANRLLGALHRSIQSKVKAIILPLYTSLVRPRFKYCVQAWSPYYRKDIDKLEKVQRRAVRMITDLRGTSYREKLLELGLFSLEKRRIRADLVCMFRILKGIDKINSEALFSLFPASSITRGHSMKVVLPRFKTDVRRYFFSSRVVSIWNTLPNDAVSCRTVTAFKNHVDNCPAFMQLI